MSCLLKDGLGEKVWCQFHGSGAFVYKRHKGQSERKMGGGTVGLLRCLLGLFSIDQSTAGSRGALYEKLLFVHGLFLVWWGLIPSWPSRSSRLWFVKRM